MKNLTVLKTIAMVCILLLAGCKQMPEGNDLETASSDMSQPTTTTAAASNADGTALTEMRQFVRTADIRFKASNVAQSTDEIEDAVLHFGGFVTSTSLKSKVSDQNRTKISSDSAVVNTTYTVENNITIRVPNKNLDTVIRTIAKQVAFLDYRIIKADDVAMQLLSSELAQKRTKVKAQRIAAAIDTKGKKLDQVVDAEQQLGHQQEDIDSALLTAKELKDQVNFSTITLQIYQNETTKAEVIALPVVNHPNFGLRITDSLKQGWYLVEGIIAGLLTIWPLFIGGLGAWFLYRKYVRAVKA